MEYKKIFLSSFILLWNYTELISLPAEILAFPQGEPDPKINPSPPIIFSEQKLRAYATSQGFCLSKDSSEGGIEFRYAARLLPGRYVVYLYSPFDLRGEKRKTGWELVMDIAAFHYCGPSLEKNPEKTGYLPSFRAEIYVQGVFVYEVEMGYGKTISSPLFIPIPFIRDEEGKVKVEIYIPYRSNNEIFIYDMFLR